MAAHRAVATPPRGLVIAQRGLVCREVREVAHQFLASLAMGGLVAALLLFVEVWR